MLGLVAAALVTFLEGEATSRIGDAAPAALGVGAKIEDGSTVATGPAARLELELPDGSLLRLSSNASFEMKSASAGSFLGRLSLGSLWAKVHKLLAGQRFEVETQNGVAGVRGTEFRVTTDAAGRSLVRVYEGRVEVRGEGFAHLLDPNREVRWSRRAVLGPRAFERRSERSAFMRWVRKRSGTDDRGERRDPRRRERVHERDRIRRDLLKK